LARNSRRNSADFGSAWAGNATLYGKLNFDFIRALGDLVDLSDELLHGQAFEHHRRSLLVRYTLRQRHQPVGRHHAHLAVGWEKGGPTLVPAGMMRHRADPNFSPPDEISGFISLRC
jgi:hypothetical protein